MNENSNKYAMAALRKKRAGISSEIIHLERQLRFRRDSLVHLDATIRLLDPDAEPEKIPNASRRVHLFKQGELGRAIVDTMRRAGEPMHVRDLVSGVMEICGQEEPARKTMLVRVRANLRYLRQNGKVEMVGAGHGGAVAISYVDESCGADAFPLTAMGATVRTEIATHSFPSLVMSAPILLDRWFRHVPMLFIGLLEFITYPVAFRWVRIALLDARPPSALIAATHASPNARLDVPAWAWATGRSSAAAANGSDTASATA